jgi:hypothetical protein
MRPNTGGILNADCAMTLPQKARSNRPPEVYRRVFLSTIDPARLIAANINPTTLLATDYLNHFNEASMMLEMLPEIPDCITDLVQWRPLTYAEHFTESNFKDRELAIAAHELADPDARRRLDELADEMKPFWDRPSMRCWTQPRSTPRPLSSRRRSGCGCWLPRPPRSSMAAA